MSDPDNNGIEVYRDRPRSDWYDKNGNFQMGTLPVDVKSVLGRVGARDRTVARFASRTVLGHMHLKSANVNRDEPFYRDVIGFDEMANLGGSAAFLSAGGYHHHLGMNMWESANASPAPQNSVGLQYFTVKVPTPEELTRVAHRVRQAGLELQETEAGLLVRDPSENGVVLTTK